MKNSLCFAVILSVVVGGMPGLAEMSVPVKVKVLKNNVNLRTKPLPSAEVMGQVSENTILTSRTMDQDWVEIVSPATVDMWVLSDYVKDGVITCKQKVNVRSGAGINFTIITQLAPETPVTVRGMHAEWTKIAPPESCSLWIARAMVEPVSEKPAVVEPPLAKVEAVPPEPPKTETILPKAEPPKTGAEAKSKSQPPKPAPVVSAVPALPATPATNLATVKSVLPVEPGSMTTSAPPTDLELISSVGQGQLKQYEGKLRPRNFFVRSPGKFRLVVYDAEQNPVTVCYVKGNNAQLHVLLNRAMVIYGREYWVKKQKYPVIVPERIVLK